MYKNYIKLSKLDLFNIKRHSAYILIRIKLKILSFA